MTAPRKLLPYKTRRRWALVLLLIGLPAYVVLVVNLMAALPRLPFWIEVLAYLMVGTIWIFPLKRVFLGLGQPDPDRPTAPNPGAPPGP
jgi:membrane protein implicated in regulation of membrane protease activity